MVVSVLDPPAGDVDAPAEGDARSATWLLFAIVLVGVGLRAWRLGFNGLSYDESFTAMASRMDFGSLLAFLRSQDSHPPLDYLLRAPLARAGAPDAVVRVPSFVFSASALVLFAWWVRERGTAALVAVAVFSFSSFEIQHGGEARMYALLQLLGVAGAVIASRWVVRPSRTLVVAASVLVVVALFDHVSGVLLAAGLFALAGVRRDRAAWEWRAGLVLAGLLWAVLWGPSFVHQAGSDWVGWIPPTSPSSFAAAVSGQVLDASGAKFVVLACVAVGGWCLWRADARLGRTWLAVGAAPFVVAAAVGFVSPFLIDRTLTVASWAPALALGFGGAALLERSRLVGAAVVAVGLVVVLSMSTTFLASKRYDADLAIAHLERVVQPGDVVVTRPSRYATLPEYRIGVEGDGVVRRVPTPGIDSASAFRSGEASTSGRLWLFTPDSFETAFAGYAPCPAAPGGSTRAWTDGVTHVVCLERAPD